MNYYRHFGELLEQLRLSNNMTQVEAAQGICTLRQYSRLEKGESTPRIDILYGLSAKFNTNLYDYYNIHFSHQSFEAYDCIMDLNNSISTGTYTNLEAIVARMKNLKEFEDGDNFKHLCYAQALTEFMNNHYDASVSFCLKGLQINNFDDFKMLPKNQLYTNIELCLMNCLGCSFGSLSDFKKANMAFITLIEAFDYQSKKLPFSVAKSSSFVQNCYENAIYNLGITYYRENSLKPALKYIQKGIDFSVMQNNISYLPSLLEMKGYILCKQKKLKEAKECLQIALNLLTLKLDLKEQNNNMEYIKKRYDEISQKVNEIDKE